jgi:hypothetical protein
LARPDKAAGARRAGQLAQRVHVPPSAWLRRARQRLQKQFTWLDVQRFPHPRQREQRGVGLAGFDLLPVAPVHLGATRSLLEREKRSFTPRTHIGTKSTAEDSLGDGKLGHAPMETYN